MHTYISSIYVSVYQFVKSKRRDHNDNNNNHCGITQRIVVNNMINKREK